MSAIELVRDALFGNPPSPTKQPSREGLLAAFTEVVNQVALGQSSVKIVATTADMAAFDATEANRGKLVYVNNNNGSATDPANGVYEYVDGVRRLAQSFYSGVASIVQPLVDSAEDSAEATELVANTLADGAAPAFPIASNVNDLRADAPVGSTEVPFEILVLEDNVDGPAFLETAPGFRRKIARDGAGSDLIVGDLKKGKVAQLVYSVGGGVFLLQGLRNMRRGVPDQVIDPDLSRRPWGAVTFAGGGTGARTVTPVTKRVTVIGSSNAHPDYVSPEQLPANVAAAAFNEFVPGTGITYVADTQAQPGAPMVTAASQLAASTAFIAGNSPYVLAMYGMNDARTLFYHDNGGVLAEIAAMERVIEYVRDRGAEIALATIFPPDPRAAGTIALDPNYYASTAAYPDGGSTRPMNFPAFHAAPVSPENHMEPRLSQLTEVRDWSGGGASRTGYKRIWHVNYLIRELARKYGCALLDFEFAAYRYAIETVPDLGEGLDAFYNSADPLHPKMPLYDAAVTPVIRQWALAVSRGENANRVFKGTIETSLVDVRAAIGSSVDQAQKWAEGTLPGGTGTKSAREWSADASATALALSGSLAAVTEPTLSALTDALAYDVFQRADGPLGTSTSGKAWNVLSGSATISNKKVAGSMGLAVMDLGSPDVEVTARFDPPTLGASQVVIRALDATNYIFVNTTSTQIRLTKKDAGVDAPLASVTTTLNFSVPLSLTAKVVGNVIQVFRDGQTTPLITYTLTGPEQDKYGSVTQHGFYTHTTSRVASFVARRGNVALANANAAQKQLDGVKSILPAITRADAISYDTFLRDNSATPGIAPSGQAYQLLTGTAAISGNRMTGVEGLVVIDAGTPDVDVRATIDTGPSSISRARIAVRVVDANNYIYFILTGTAARYVRRIAGSDGTPLEVPLTVASGVIDYRVVTSGDRVRFYVNGGSTPVFDQALTASEKAVFGSATKHGLYLRTNVAATKLSIYRTSAVEVAVAGGGRGIAAVAMQSELRKMARFATRHRNALLTATVTTNGLTFDSPSDKPTQFRGGLNTRYGDFIGITRNSGFFPRRFPDGTWIKAPIKHLATGVPLTPTEMYNLNLSGGVELPDGDHLYPPRDDNFFAIVNWRDNTIRFTNFGIDISALGLDKFTGCAWVGRYIFALWNTAPFFIVIDPFTTTSSGEYKAWKDSFGLINSANGKPFAGGTTDSEGFLVGAPFDNLNPGTPLGVYRIDPERMEGYYFDNGLDLTGDSMWCSPRLCPDGRVWWVARGAPNVLRWDATKSELKKLNFAHIPAVNAAMVLGGNKWTRNLFTPNFKLIATPGDRNDCLVIDTLLPDDHPDQAKLLFDGVLPTTTSKYIGGSLTENDTTFVGDQARHFVHITSSQSEPTPPDLVMASWVNQSP